MKRQQVDMSGKTLRAWREIKGWTQVTTAQEASKHGTNVSPSTIAMIELGTRQPSVDVAKALAAAFEVDVEVIAWIKPGADIEPVADPDTEAAAV